MPAKFDPKSKEALLSRDRLDPHRLISLIPILPHHVVAVVRHLNYLIQLGMVSLSLTNQSRNFNDICYNIYS